MPMALGPLLEMEKVLVFEIQNENAIRGKALFFFLGSHSWFLVVKHRHGKEKSIVLFQGEKDKGFD